MEFPDLGKQCSSSYCNRLDFLPMKCDACEMIFCKDHYQYTNHQCPKSYQHDVQVPVCPLCNQPVPSKRGEAPDIRVGEHIDRDCQSDPALAKRKVYTNKCNQKGCKHKDMIKIACSQCGKNFCLKHRFPQDHNCQGTGRNITQAGAAALSRLQGSGGSVNKSSPITSFTSRLPNLRGPNIATTTTRPTPVAAVSSVQGNLSEDEALAMALQKSLSEQSRPSQVSSRNLTQEEADRQLALALAESDRQQTTVQNQRQRSGNNCSVS